VAFFQKFMLYDFKVESFRNKHKQRSNVLITILSATCQKIKRLLQHSEAKFQTTEAVLLLFRSFLPDHYFQSKRSRKLCLAAMLRKRLNYKRIIIGCNKGPTHLMVESEGHWRPNVALTNLGLVQVLSLSLGLLAFVSSFLF
jgi:hypothetical protein